MFTKRGEHTRKRDKKHPREKKERPKLCYRCGHSDHFAKDPSCSAKGQTCRKCIGKYHFAKMCKFKSKLTVKSVGSAEPKINYAFVVKHDSNTEGITFNLGGVDLVKLINSGASSNVVDEGTWEMLKRKIIECVSSTTVMKPLYSYSSKTALSVKDRQTLHAG